MADPPAATSSEAVAAASSTDKPSTMSSTPAASTKLSAERDKKRIALRAQNLDVWQNGPKQPTASLDSNMKKNTGFIKKVRQGLTADVKPQLLKEAATLNLDKYVEELVQAVPEGLAKCTTAKDAMAALEVGYSSSLADPLPLSHFTPLPTDCIRTSRSLRTRRLCRSACHCSHCLDRPALQAIPPIYPC